MKSTAIKEYTTNLDPCYSNIDYVSYIIWLLILLLCSRNGYIKRFSYNCTTFGKNGRGRIIPRNSLKRRENSESSLPSSVMPLIYICIYCISSPHLFSWLQFFVGLKKKNHSLCLKWLLTSISDFNLDGRWLIID